MRIEEIDKNFSASGTVPENTVFTSIEEKPFKIYGIKKAKDCFFRLPENTAAKVNDGTKELCFCTAGGRVRFSSNSEYIVLYVKLNKTFVMPHATFLLCGGFDIYRDGKFFYTTKPACNPLPEAYTAYIPCYDNERHEYTVVFPCYGGVSKLLIGISPNAELFASAPYKAENPVIYYGSSITQGGCASRPGLTYQELISRRLDVNYYNLGFSGSAHGEEAMAHYINGYIKSHGASLFCYDYDHNAPNAEHLKNTHERFFKIIRNENPALPVIFITRPDWWASDSPERRDIIEQTYKNAVASGDKNVYFVDGKTFGTDPDSTVDGCHPNDIGFYLMAKTIGDKIEEVLF